MSSSVYEYEGKCDVTAGTLPAAPTNAAVVGIEVDPNGNKWGGKEYPQQL